MTPFPLIYINLPPAVNPKVAGIETSIRGVYESPSAPERASGAVITEWRPEDPVFWQQRGQRIASRNLWISVPCLLLAFCVWMLFSAVAVNLPKVGFNFTTEQLFMLTALPSVSTRCCVCRTLYGSPVWWTPLDGIQHRYPDRPMCMVRFCGAGYHHAI